MWWDETVKEIKQKLSKQKNVDADNVDLVLHGKRLKDNEKWFQVEVFDQKDRKNTSVQQRLKRLLPGASDQEADEIPVLQVVNR